MAYQKKSYVEHVAVRVRDIHWHIRFFREVLGMTIHGPDSSGPSNARAHRTTEAMSMVVEKYWDDAKVGDEGVSPTMTVTGAMIDTYADLTGDRTPLHIDEEYARKSHFGERVAHGLFGLSVADGLKCQSEYRFLPGMSLGWNWDFLLPIRIGDTLHIKFRVGTMRPSNSKPDWGIVIIPVELINQKGEVVQRGEHKLMVPRRPAAAAA